jgi:hypothetical protein
MILVRKKRNKHKYKSDLKKKNYKTMKHVIISDEFKDQEEGILLSET